MSAKNCTDDEFKVLLYVAEKYNLDPLTKQIYSQKYAGSNPQPAAIIITYAGMQEIANRDNQLDGLSCEAVWGTDGKTLLGARSTLWKKGCVHPFVVEVDFNEYIQYNREGKPQGLWLTKPITMIKKVANAQNMRQAFSLGQMYAEEEMPMAQEERQQEVVEVRPVAELIRPIAPTVAAPQAPVMTISENERRKRIADAAAIDLSYDLKTVNDWGEFLPITMKDTLACLEKMIGTTSFISAAKVVGVTGFEGEVKRRYPDTQVQAQRFSATLHFVFNWAKEQADHQAEREAARATAT